MRVAYERRPAHAPVLHAHSTVTQTVEYLHLGLAEGRRFRYALCDREFGKIYLGAEEMRRAYRLAVEHDVHANHEICYGAPTSKQAGRPRAGADLKPPRLRHRLGHEKRWIRAWRIVLQSSASRQVLTAL